MRVKCSQCDIKDSFQSINFHLIFLHYFFGVSLFHFLLMSISLILTMFCPILTGYIMVFHYISAACFNYLIIFMNKIPHRYDKSDNLSRIQANLNNMKDEVSEYLKKSNIDTVPPILRARNYLILSYIQNINSKEHSEENPKIKKDLSSEQLGNAADGEKFEPLREAIPEKNRNAKHKRSHSGPNSGTHGADCLLPSIGQLKLDFETKIVRNSAARKNIVKGRSIQIRQQNYDQFLKVRKHLSIEMRSTQPENPQLKQAKPVNKRLSASMSRDIMNSVKHQFSLKMNDNLSFSLEDSIPTYSQLDDLQSNDKYQQIQAKINLKRASHQRKMSSFRRRIANLGNLKPQPYQEEKDTRWSIKNHQQSKLSKESMNKPRKIDPNECCPWSQTDNYQEKSLYIEEVQFF